MKNTNKKKVVIILSIILISIILSIYKINTNKNDFQDKIPIMNIVTSKDNVKYKAISGDGNWVNTNPPAGNLPGNGYIVDVNKVFKNNCLFIEVNPGDELKFDINYENRIEEVSLGNFDISSQKRENILSINKPYTYKVPEEKKDYYYLLNVRWDSNHNFDYLFKIKVV